MATTRSVRVGLAVAFVGLAAAMVACGGEVVDATGGQGGGGSGGGTTSTATGGAGGGSTTTNTTTTTSTTTTTTTSGGVCAPFADEQGTSSVTVRFRNETGMPLYLPANCNSVDYTIKPPGGGDPAVSYAYSEACLQTCEDLWTSAPYACGACAPTTYRIEPGASREVVWNGTGLSYSNPMPAECYAYPNVGNDCRRIVAAPAGAYFVDARGFAACDGDCACDSNGLCNGYATGAEAISSGPTLNFPGDAVVEVLFGPCAFGCP